MHTIQLTHRGATPRELAASALSHSPLSRPVQWLTERLFGGFVLAFHSMGPDLFRGLIEALEPNEVVPLDEMITRVTNGKRTDGLFAVTVDDGVGQNVEGLAAVAMKHHWPISFYLPTRYLDERRGMPFQWLDRVLPCLPKERIKEGTLDLDASSSGARRRLEVSMRRLMYTRPAEEYRPLIDQLVECAVRHGWTSRQQLEPPAPLAWEKVAALARHSAIRFESHGVTHIAVSALTPDRLEAELVESRQRISEHTNRQCRHFCYPFGGPESIGAIAPRLVRRYFDSGVTMSRGRVNGRDPFLLPRIPIYGNDTVAVGRLKVLTW
jgi:hypothetical protein